jgi:hypothetical protein
MGKCLQYIRRPDRKFSVAGPCPRAVVCAPYPRGFRIEPKKIIFGINIFWYRELLGFWTFSIVRYSRG